MSNVNFQTTKKTIGNNTFIVARYSAREALKITRILGGLMSPVISRILGGLNIQNLISKKKNLSDSDIKIDGDKIGEALEKMFNNLEEEDFMSLVDRLLQNTTVEINEKGKKKIFSFVNNNEAFDIAFQDNPLDVYKVLYFVLGINFPNFFSRIKNIGTQLTTIISGVADKTEVND